MCSKFSIYDFQVTKNSIAVSWLKPEYDGGSTISSYILETSISEENNYTSCGQVKGNVFGYTITGLTENTSYDIQVRAVNETGTSEPCTPVFNIVTKDLSGWILLFFFVVEVFISVF